MDPQFIVQLDGGVGDPRNHHLSLASEAVGLGLSPARSLPPPVAGIGAGVREREGSSVWEKPHAFGVRTFCVSRTKTVCFLLGPFL